MTTSVKMTDDKKNRIGTSWLRLTRHEVIASDCRIFSHLLPKTSLLCLKRDASRWDSINCAHFYVFNKAICGNDRKIKDTTTSLSVYVNVKFGPVCFIRAIRLKPNTGVNGKQLLRRKKKYADAKRFVTFCLTCQRTGVK